MDRFEDMRCFVNVAELQSVTRAAEKLNLAPSAVSRRLKDLEARLGAQLLSRTTRKMSLTEPGQVFFNRARQILADIDEAEGEVSDASHGLSGQLRVAAPLSFGLGHLTPMLCAFMEAHPDLRVQVDLADRMVDLVGEGFDLAVRIGELPDSSLIARRLCTVRMVAVASPKFLNRHGRPSVPDDLRALPALCYAGSERPDIWRYTDRSGAESSVQVQMRMLANNGDMLCDAAAEGLGVTLQPSFIAHSSIVRGRLEEVCRGTDWSEISVQAVYPETRHLSAKSRAFIDALRDHFSESPPEWDVAIAS